MASTPQPNRHSVFNTNSSKVNFVAKNANKNNGKRSQGVEVNVLLRSQIAHLWPTITTLTALQKDCIAVLPQLFLHCQVLHLETERLTLCAPNGALASKLKQQLPLLQSALQKAGWQINAIRIKVQVNAALPEVQVEKSCQLSESALNAFNNLEKNLAGSHRNDELLGALRTLISRPR